MIKFTHKGSFKNTEAFFKRVTSTNFEQVLAPLAERGVAALEAATPKDTGKTAASWKYKITLTGKAGAGRRVSIEWYNTNVSQGWANIAILLQYGHATRNGGWVEGVDYINPAMKPVFDEIADEAWRMFVDK